MLLESSKTDAQGHTSYLFENPDRVITARNLGDVEHALAEAEAASRRGSYVAGYIAYEAGYAFEPSLQTILQGASFDMPLVWLGVYGSATVFDHSANTAQTEDDSIPGIPAAVPAFDLPQAEYSDRVEAIRRWIERGDAYQANLTLEAHWTEEAGPAELLQRLMRAQPVEFGALINLGEQQIVSASPELFFKRAGSSIMTRPMKGTAGRGRWAEEDDVLAEELRSDTKNRAENVMIVDLLRNDLGRICEHGSVRVPDLFRVERFPSVLQMTSTIEGTLKPHTGFAEIMRALFPCGSIVGAPKIRTMQILRAIEQRNRGVYTGAIGFIAPGGEDAAFSVAIRTVTLQKQNAIMGVGSGIVYDSRPDSEYEECRIKVSFINAEAPQFELIETLLWDRGYTFLDEHLARVESSARYFGYAFNREDVLNALHAETRIFACGSVHRVRLLVARKGTCTVSSTALPDSTSERAVSVLLSGHRTRSSDHMLFHKTTARAVYNAAHQRALALRCQDAIFLNERDEVTEGAIHNIIIVRNGAWITPAVQSGLLRGIYRKHLLHTRRGMREEIIRMDDLLCADEIYICNSVRGLRRVERILQETPNGPRLIFGE